MTSALVIRTDANGPTPTPTSTPTSTAAPTGELLTTKFLTIAGHPDAHATVPGRITLVLPTCIQTEISDKNGFPSYSVLFGVVTALHIAQTEIQNGQPADVLASRMGSLKTLRHSAGSSSWLILVLMAPLWVNAFDYMVLARMIHFFLPSHSILGISGSLFGITFVMLDVVSFVVQLIGGTLAGPTAPESEVFKGILSF
ncbi:hypothetical protein C8J57DRAFT_1510984 [Mycena rebaudengoi]|nr:hypothetical protein C8J57DRAFT_1510984 [Mycena rebaudengoi]